MLKVTSKKVMTVITVSSMLLAVGAVAYADTTLKKISAYQNAAISIEVDNQKVNLSSNEGTMYPIVYEGHSYVSAKAVAEALGATVKWDNSRKTVAITSGNGGTAASVVPDKDNTVVQATAKPAATAAPQATAVPQATPKPAASSTSSNSGTSFANAVSIGTPYTFTDIKNDEDGEADTSSAQYTFTINKVTPFSLQQMKALGYDVSASYAAEMDFVMLDVSLKVKNATLTKGSDGSGSRYLSMYYPYMWGVQTPSGNYNVGKEYIGFDGSLMDNIYAALPEFPEIKPGETGSYEASGKVILPVIKGEDNYFVLEKLDYRLKYEDSFIYFKIK
ncbi:stalk domain-containing protein [Paenibacillus sp. FSL R7-0331]|uniref:stalk domain-containing protein n=1 Tax=Paenibacillus sp. FSL R7-0331 TaxID=1536773 RepID=UPI000694C561|nr:stalk domain-containing protein [Paenibacillus sp. FSL R7-0331]